MTGDISARLASALGDRTQNANKRLAEQIASQEDDKAIAELMELLRTGSRAQKIDAVKVIAEISLRTPGLLTKYVDDLVEIAISARGVLIWESVTALAGIAEIDPSESVRALDLFRSALEGDSVIARDQAVRSLCSLAGGGHYSTVMPLLLDALLTAQVNQFPTYAEKVVTIARDCDRPRLAATLERRIGEMPNPAKSRRVSALLKTLV